MQNKLNLLLFFILLISFAIGVYKNDQIPAGFFADEAAIGYNAYSLLKRGTDEYGVPFPFFFRSFGDYRLPVPIYSNIPFIALLGLNESSVRTTAAFFGTATIFFLYLLTYQLFKKQFLALLAALFLMTSPWHIHFSRFGSEYIFFPFWLVLGWYLFLKGLEKKKFFYFSFFAFGIGLYTYYPALFTIPLFLTILILINRKKFFDNKKSFLISLSIFFILLIPFFVGIKDGTVLTRWQSVSVFKDSSLQIQVMQMVKTYVAHFSPTFLFEKGDLDFPGHFITRFSTRGFGQLYFLQFPLVLLGFYTLIYKIRQLKTTLTLISLLALYPLGSTLTGTDGGGPFAFRSIIGVIPFQIISALGAYTSIIWVKNNFKTSLSKNLAYLYMSILFSFMFVFYLYNYFNHYPLYSSDFWGWQYGPREVMDYFLEEADQYDQMFIVGNFNSPEIFPKFYDPINLCNFKCQVGNLKNISSSKKQLFAIGIDRLAENNTLKFNVQKVINFPNGKPAFFIGELTEQQP